VQVPGETEIVFRSPTVSGSATGLTIRSDHFGATRPPTVPRGRRLRVELLDDRAGLAFSGIVLDQRLCERPDAGSALELILFPVGVTERRASRRARHRVEVLDDVAVELRMAVSEDRCWGHLHDLSAEGAGVVVTGQPPREGTIVDLRMPVEGGRKALVRAEVLHATKEGPGATRLGLRFTDANERMRALFQREVLRHERRLVQFNRKELVLTEDLPTMPGAAGPRRDAWDTDHTVDLT
jgi:c-di-GMP-binding flagellar brake protein YcgR